MSDTLYFLKEDLEGLDRAIKEVDERIHEILSEMSGENDGGNTWHDNFAYEEGQRGATMWSSRLRELIAIRNNAQIVTPPALGNQISIGRTVTIEDCSTKETSHFRISSYMIFKKRGEAANGGEVEDISYMSPIARILMGAKVGDVKEGAIGEKIKQLRVVKIK